MKQPQISRLVTRRSFTKTTLTGVGTLIGIGIWSKAHATAYNTNLSEISACIGEIESVCNAKFGTADQSLDSKRNRCIWNLKRAHEAGRANPFKPSYPMVQINSGSMVSASTSTDCNYEMNQLGTYMGLSAGQIDDLQDNCCHANP